MKNILDLIPEDPPAQVYDVRKVIQSLRGPRQLLRVEGALLGRSATTAFTRIDGRAVGIVANNPQFKGGAIDADACSKITSTSSCCCATPTIFRSSSCKTSRASWSARRPRSAASSAA